MSDRKAYPSDLIDAEWEILEPLIPEVSPNATTETIPRREIVNGIPFTSDVKRLEEAPSMMSNCFQWLGSTVSKLDVF
jgi:hypothetical protein